VVIVSIITLNLYPASVSVPDKQSQYLFHSRAQRPHTPATVSFLTSSRSTSPSSSRHPPPSRPARRTP